MDDEARKRFENLEKRLNDLKSYMLAVAGSIPLLVAGFGLFLGFLCAPPLILCHRQRSLLQISFDAQIKLPEGVTHTKTPRLGPPVPQSGVPPV